MRMTGIEMSCKVSGIRATGAQQMKACATPRTAVPEIYRSAAPAVCDVKGTEDNGRLTLMPTSLHPETRGETAATARPFKFHIQCYFGFSTDLFV